MKDINLLYCTDKYITILPENGRLRYALHFLTSYKNFRTTSLFILLLLLPVLNGLAKEIQVSSSGKISSIREAIKLAQPQDVIIIHKGVYRESGILIDKPLTLKGLDSPVIDGEMKGEIFTIAADSVTIEGLTIRNVEVSHIKDNAAIRIARRKHCAIKNNKIYNAFFGIYLEKADSCIVSGNLVSGIAKTETSSGNAIHLWYCNNIQILNNKSIGHRDGIYLEFVTKSTITGNTSTSNLRYGLHFMFSDGNVYRKNQFLENGSGVAVMYSKNIEMTDNIFRKSWGAAAYGILLKDISDSKIEKNKFEENTIGIHAEGSNRISISNNEFKQNGWAIKLMGSCESINFNYNNFISNTFEVATSNNYKSNNTFSNNYWSSYTGYDLDKDGKGDVPHKPVKLFSYMMENVPTSMILSRSLFIDLLELAEKVAPVLTPVNILDNEPNIKPNLWKP